MKTQLTEERTHLGYSLRGIGVPHHHGRENGSRQVGIAMGKPLRAHFLSDQQEAESGLGMAGGF